VLIYQAVNF